jgi:hypothetical protein
MLYPLRAHQIIAGDNDEVPPSGPRKRISSTARTVAMEVPRPAPASQIRRVQIEHLVPLERGSANDVEANAVLISSVNPRVTRYCFIAPRTSSR